jgi:uncharacterized RDD family membrane protein YckC
VSQQPDPGRRPANPSAAVNWTAADEVTGADPGADPSDAVERISSAASRLIFGQYCAIRELGRGGMGVVYEAEDADSGRHVALKVLAATLQDEPARERFVREGRLAASVSHPHCVFVFGAAEADGHPVIAMELMAGTLADRLKREGPLPPAAAVDAVLQVVAGLQAAADAGILHRDVKPSNCFVDADGVIKIGDFGIARSQHPQEDTQLPTRGTVVGTPAYASPEQLRGAPLDVRADIYSVGATLYELVTGRRPFEGGDLLELLMRIANDPPAPPHAIASAVPRGLSAAILRCLAKAPEHRFANYDALIAALEPYSSAATTPATLGRRFAAGVVDNALAGLGTNVLLFGAGFMNVWLYLGGPVLMLLYYVIGERFWGATAGKALFGLRVVGQRGEPARTAPLAARAAMYVACFAASSVLPLAFWDTSELLRLPPSMAFLLLAPQSVLLALLFSTARRANGYAGVHDLVMHIRVVERRRRPTRTPGAVSVGLPASATIGRVGPFDLLDGRVPGLPDEWRPGFDRRLRRSLWLRLVTPDTPPIPVQRRFITRPTRLRWLAGRRQPDAAWDAFEAVAGVPLAEACRQPGDWAEVRWWLRDLARECAAASPHDRAPRRPDRVWVLAAGGAKLIDDPVADQATPDGHALSPSDERFLLDVARLAQAGSGLRTPEGSRISMHSHWPLSARSLLDQLARGGTDVAAVVESLERLTRQRPSITRGWRALPIAATILVPLIFAATAGIGMSSLAAEYSAIPLDVRSAAMGLTQLRRADRGRITLTADEREAIERTLVTRYRSVLEDRALFEAPNPLMMALFSPSERAIAADLLRQHPFPPAIGPEETAAAVDRLEKAAETVNAPPQPRGVFIGVLLGVLVVIAVLSLTCALAFRGGLMRQFHLELVNAHGEPASRVRVLARHGVAWLPLLLPAVLVWVYGPTAVVTSPLLATVAAVSLVTLLAGAVAAIINPRRGVQDWIARTWIVPR